MIIMIWNYDDNFCNFSSESLDPIRPITHCVHLRSQVLFTAGNLGLSLPGLVELLSRLAARSRLDTTNVKSLRSLLRIMDVSKGKHILAEASRGSIVIKVFNTSVESAAPSDSSSQSPLFDSGSSSSSGPWFVIYWYPPFPSLSSCRFYLLFLQEEEEEEEEEEDMRVLGYIKRQRKLSVYKNDKN